MRNVCEAFQEIVNLLGISQLWRGTLLLESLSLVNAVTHGNNRDNYWFYDCGTSMSSPHAAGIFALWLQADASLKPSQLKEIAVSTAQRGYSDIANPAWGAGAIDAVEGLKEVLRRSGVSSVSVSPIIKVSGRRLYVDTPGCDRPAITVADVSGHNVDASSELNQGVYIVKIATDNGTYTYKIYIR